MASITAHIVALKNGSASAFGWLYGRFMPRLTDYATSLIRHLPGSRAYGEEVAQDAAFGLFSGVRNSKELSCVLTDSESLWRLLQRLARDKAAKVRRYFGRKRRDPRRLVDWENRTDDCGSPLDHVPSREPPPDAGAVEREFIDAALRHLPNEHLRTVADLRLRGHAVEEIAGIMGRPKRAVERYLFEIRACWRALLPEGDG